MSGANRARQLRSVCACPACHGPLTWERSRTVCEACDSAYALHDGVPLLLPTQLTSLESDSRWSSAPALGSRPRVKRVADAARRRINPSPVFKTTHGRRLVEEFVSSFGPDDVVLNIGAGATRYSPTLLNLEIAPGPDVDVVGVAEFLPIASASCHGIVLIAVLEHVQDADMTLSEAGRALVAGGRIFVDVPFIQGYHAAPGDYRRYTEQGLCAELQRHGFTVEESGVSLGPASAMSWITAEYLALLVSGRSALGYRIARNVTGVLAAPLKYADAWLDRHPMASRIASGVWVAARRTS